MSEPARSGDVTRLSYDDAVAMLDVDDGRVHTILDGGIALMGEDWDLADVLALLRDGRPELSGEQATAMCHGLVAFRGAGINRPVFIATKQAVTP
jgi:hypothetical protein